MATETVMQINTTNTSAGSSASDTFVLPLESTGTYSFDIDWGDGSGIDTITAWNQAEVTHVYSSGGAYTIEITGTLTGWRFNNTGDRLKLLSCDSFHSGFTLGNNNGYFYGCSNLTSLSVDLDTSSVTNFYTAWYNCSSLTSFPLIDTSSGTNFYGAWYACSSLTSFPLIDTSGGTNFSYAWNNCSLTSFPLIDTSSGTNFSYAWTGNDLTSFPLIDTSSGTDFTYAWWNNELTSFPLINTGLGTNFFGAWGTNASLTSFPLIDTSSGTNFSYAWRDCSSLASFPLIDTSSGTNFTYAWQNCTSLTSFPLINTSSGATFAGSWFGCSSLTSFPLINTSSVTNFSYAWQNCTSLISFSLIDTSSCINFYAAWRNCSSLTSFPLIDTSSGITFYTAWHTCSSLTSFPLIDTSSGTDFGHAWSNCTSLTSFPVIDLNNASNLTNTFNGVTLDIEVYTLILMNLAANNVNTSISFNAGALTKYWDFGIEPRAYLVDDLSWTITDGGLDATYFPSYLTTLPFLPEKSSYSYNQLDGLLSVELEGGLSKSRVDKKGKSQLVDCQWILDEKEFLFFMQFKEVIAANGANRIKVNLILDSNTVELYDCKIVPDSVVLSQPSSVSFVVSCQLEIDKKNRETTFTEMLETYATLNL